jgi:hypothetical protein
VAPDDAADVAAIVAGLRRLYAAKKPSAKHADPAEVRRASESLRRALGLDRPGFQTLSASFPELQPVEAEPFDIESWVERAYAVIERRQRGGGRRRRGRGLGEVSEREANKAADIYLRNRRNYRKTSDGGAYAVHKLYLDATEDPGLSRPMVGHLLRAIDKEWLTWDQRTRSLKIPFEFQTSEGMFVIPRRKPGL